MSETPNDTARQPTDGEFVAGAIHRIADRIAMNERAIERNSFTRISHINSIVNGHLLVLWAMAINVLAIITLGSKVATVGALCCAGAHACAWGAESAAVSLGNIATAGQQARLRSIQKSCYAAGVGFTLLAWAAVAFLLIR